MVHPAEPVVGDLQPAEKDRRGGKDQGQVQLNLCAEIYEMKRKAGWYFVNEHPKSACSWNETSINDISEDDEVFKAEACMCAFATSADDATGKGPVTEPTTFL